MNALIFYGLMVIGGVAVVRALFSARPPQPAVIYVVAEPETAAAQGGTGCLPLVIVGGRGRCGAADAGWGVGCSRGAGHWGAAAAKVSEESKGVVRSCCAPTMRLAP